MADRASYALTARGYSQQQQQQQRSSSKDSVLNAIPEKALPKQHSPHASSASPGAIIASSTHRPMPPSGSGPGKRRPNFSRQQLSRLEVPSVNLPAPPHTVHELPSQTADAELQEHSNDSLPNVLPLRICSRQRRRFFGPALAWSAQQARNMSRTLDFSALQWQPPPDGGEDEDTAGGASSDGSEVKLDKDPEAILMRQFLQSKIGEHDMQADSQ
eukprot:TRINITY_DN21449_c0_g1_i1.p1 TRINITY_DN21449_c0_g1~~TRINITY_DN21449_c0_g1_i1.p1  ORF type:complete len:215 (-),score=43.75 TRINITY_DN21449_c0_g1_i1:150-794(-)